jgi:hypothetical protein
MSLNSNNLASKNTSGNIITPIMLYPSPSVSCTHGGLLMSPNPNHQEKVTQQSDKLGHIGNPYYGLYGYGYGYGYPWWYPYHNYSCCGYRGYYGYPWYI